MKKVLWMVLGMMVLCGTAMADCGTCKASQKSAKKAIKARAAVCDVKGTCQVEEAKEKIAGKMKAAKQCGPNCKKPCCAPKVAKDNASEKAQEQRKKWWKFGFDK